MKRILTILVCGLVLLGLTACFEIEQHYTLNPDGSGKVVHRVKKPDIMGEGENGLAGVVKSQLTEAKGIDTWSDVTAEIADDGSFLFQGTAYFSDLNQVELKDSDDMKFAWSKNADGGMQISLVQSKEGGETKAKATPTKKPLTPEEVDAEIKKARNEWTQMKPMMQAVFGAFKSSTTFELPAPIQSSASFQQIDDHTVRFDMEGSRWVTTIDEIFANEELLKKLAREGSLDTLSPESSEPPPEVMGKLFGDPRGVMATTSGKAKPRFDYVAEKSEAEAGYDAMLATLPVSKEALDRAVAAMAPPAQGGDFSSLKVLSTKYSIDEENSWSGVGVEVEILGVLPGSVVTVTEGTLRVAKTDNGQSVLPEEEWDRSISASLDEDMTTVKFTVKTALPAQGFKGFREISGVLLYKAAAGESSKVDLGFARIAAGATGSRFDARIAEIEPSSWNEGQEDLSLEVGLDRDSIAGVEFTRADGSPLEVENSGTSWSGDTTTFSFSIDGEFPADAKIILDLRGELKTYEIPFKITNIDLTGRPMK